LAALLCGCTSSTPDSTVRRASSPARFEHAVLIVVDTLRADALAKSHTPSIDQLAASSVQVRRAWASGTWTVPSIISLFTGAPVRTHGWDLPAAQIGRYPKLPDRPLLAEVLSAHGFQTTAMVSNPYLTQTLGFDRGFDRYLRTSDTAMLGSVQRSFLQQRDPARRQFLYLHLMGPHSPLSPSPEARARHSLEDRWFEGPSGLQIGAAKRNRLPGVRAAYRSAYYAAVEDTDVQIGALLAALGSLGPNTLVILTSDHGELLGEHSVVGHGRHLWEPLTSVPLIVGDVQGLPPRLSIDAIPDLMTKLLGVPASWPTKADASGPLVSQREGALAMSRDGEQKLIWNSEGSHRYDLAQDPGEQTRLLMDHPDLEARAAWEARVQEGPALPLEVELLPSTKKALRALGYAD
jgi:arylsulfatase A-like enzyme